MITLPKLYAISDRSLANLSNVEIARQLIDGGARLIQLRDKEATAKELFDAAREILPLTRAVGGRLIINDRVDVALTAEADGVHLGQEDLTVEEAREILGPDRIIGISTHNRSQFEAALRTSADYIAVGPVFATTSKENPDPVVGLEMLREVTDLESRQLKLQETQAKAIADENKLLTSRNELLNAIADLRGIENEYADKIAKAQSDRFEANSGQFEAEANVMKLENQYSNYERRRDLYYVLAPQTGYIARVLVQGLGETIKEGEELVSIMPAESDFAVELYVQPRDLPLVHKKDQVRLIFDGWPALVFSGWPGASTGTFAGEVFAIDKFISPNGKYRILVSPIPGEVPWPNALQFGSGAKGMVMLHDVPIWYELWRRINGFPPTFYKGLTGEGSEKSTKSK